MRLSRRGFLAAAPSAATLAAAPYAWAMIGETAGQTAGKSNGPNASSAPSDAALHTAFPAHDPAIVRDVVGASHARIDRVKQLVDKQPALARAAWDWGFGDWETALGAASHTGRIDIAEVLIANGARPDIFTFAMLGKVDAVRACVESLPNVQRIHGPHGITLMQHARNAGARGAGVVAYLETISGADDRAVSLELTAEQKKPYLGRYVFGNGPDDTFEVLVHSTGSLAIRRNNRDTRILNRVEEHAFAPAGTPAVRVRFRVSNDRCESLTVHDPHPIVTATRAN